MLQRLDRGHAYFVPTPNREGQTMPLKALFAIGVQHDIGR